ncbi:MAG: GNAT family N-acetyltransferase [Aliarcobacter sp.]|nr:GNAT family N-acetyltransferase [Aliarcobacter sp.]
MIKQADKNCKGLSTLILNAIHEVANTLTGENNKEKILETLDKYVYMDINRLSYNNIYIYEEQKQLAGLIIAYDSNKVKELDKPILKHLESKNIFLDSLEKECFENEFYIDTVSVFEEFQGHGIAKELFSFIEKKAKELGFEKISLLVDIDNLKALSLYEKIGFKKNTILQLSKHDYHHMIKML